MTTVAQVKQLVQPLLRRNPDLALVGRLVVVKPVHHVVRGIYIDRSLDPHVFVPTWGVDFLFTPGATFSFTWCDRLPNPDARGWNDTNPGLPEKLTEAIETQVLPLIRPVRSIDDFVSFAVQERFPYTFLDLNTECKLFVDIARGDLDAARAICRYFQTRQDCDWYLRELCPLIAANDRPGLARLLHGYEASSMKAEKLDKLWQPTPFPIELPQPWV